MLLLPSKGDSYLSPCWVWGWVYVLFQSLSQVWLFVIPWTVAHQPPLTMGFPGKNNWIRCYFLLQGILPSQGSNMSLLHCRQILCSWATWEAGIYNYSTKKMQKCPTESLPAQVWKGQQAILPPSWNLAAMLWGSPSNQEKRPTWKRTEALNQQPLLSSQPTPSILLPAVGAFQLMPCGMETGCPYWALPNCKTMSK